MCNERKDNYLLRRHRLLHPGNAKPLDMVDTCLCMGAGINIAQGVTHVEPDTKAFAFVGDSTFFASGITAW